jgi:hypothetical protein
LAPLINLHHCKNPRITLSAEMSQQPRCAGERLLAAGGHDGLA